MVCGWILSFPLLRSCLVDVPALLQEQNGSQSIDLAKRGHAALPRLGDCYKLHQATESAARQARRPLRSRDSMLKFRICFFSS